MSESGLKKSGNRWEWATNEWEWMRVGWSTRQHNSFIISKIYFSLLNVMFIVLYEMITVPC